MPTPSPHLNRRQSPPSAAACLGRCETATETVAETGRRASAGCRYSTRYAAAQRGAVQCSARGGTADGRFLNWAVGGFCSQREPSCPDVVVVHRWLMVRHGDYEAADFSMLRLLLREKGSCWSGGRGQCLVRDEDEGEDEEVGINPRHSFLLLFNGVVGQCWSRSGSPPDQNCFLFFFLGTLPWINVDTPPLLSTQSEFCTTLRTNEKWLPSSFPVFPRAHGRPFTHDARPIVANMLPPVHGRQ